MDDAAIFPPGDAPMPDAVEAHRRHRSSWYADLVGPFVCSDRRLPELLAALPREPSADPLPLTVVVTGGAGAIEPAVTWAGRDERLRLAGLEVALRDEEDLAHNAARMTTMLDAALPDGVRVWVELPRVAGAAHGAGWLSALDVVAAAGHQAKFRTGGLSAESFPGAAELSAAISAALDREAPFKCTAGLHHAVRHRADTGFEHHGFLNVLLATRASLDGADPSALAPLLEERSAERVAATVSALGDDRIASTRRWFVSVGSCSVADPVADLVALGLLSGDGLGAAAS